MQQRSVIRGANEFDQVMRRIHIHGQGVPQIRIEVRQPRTVDDQIKILAQPRCGLGIKPHAWLRNIAFHNFDFLGQQRA